MLRMSPAADVVVTLPISDCPAVLLAVAVWLSDDLTGDVDLIGDADLMEDRSGFCLTAETSGGIESLAVLAVPRSDIFDRGAVRPVIVLGCAAMADVTWLTGLVAVTVEDT